MSLLIWNLSLKLSIPLILTFRSNKCNLCGIPISLTNNRAFGDWNLVPWTFGDWNLVPLTNNMAFGDRNLVPLTNNRAFGDWNLVPLTFGDWNLVPLTNNRAFGDWNLVPWNNGYPSLPSSWFCGGLNAFTVFSAL